jgi:hypothetical protein
MGILIVWLSSKGLGLLTAARVVRFFVSLLGLGVRRKSHPFFSSNDQKSRGNIDFAATRALQYNVDLYQEMRPLAAYPSADDSGGGL